MFTLRSIPHYDAKREAYRHRLHGPRVSLPALFIDHARDYSNRHAITLACAGEHDHYSRGDTMKISERIITADEQRTARLSALRAKLDSLLQRAETTTDRIALASLHIAIRQVRNEISIVSREE